MRPPIFVIGSPRTGTTVLRLMLTCHRNIMIPPECGFAVWWYQKYREWGEASYSHLLGFIRDLMQSRKIETWQISEESLLEFLREKAPSSYSQLISCVYEWYGLSRGRSFKRWGDKNNFYLNHILAIKELFPTAYFVHVIRDGRDVACSYRELNARRIDSPYAPNLPNEIKEIAKQWKTNVVTINESFERIRWENVYELKFEDLILETGRSLFNLCCWLGELYDPSMLDYHRINRERELEPREFLKWKKHTLHPPVSSVVARHKRDLSVQEIGTFEMVAGDILERYGYLAC